LPLNARRAVALVAVATLGAATLAAIARLLIYALTCASLVALRRRDAAPAASFVVPGGPVLALGGMLFCGWLLGTRTASQLELLGAILVTGAALRAVARWSRRGETA